MIIDAIDVSNGIKLNTIVEDYFSKESNNTTYNFNALTLILHITLIYKMAQWEKKKSEYQKKN